MTYRVDLSKSVTKELDALARKTRDRIIEHLREIQENPRLFGSKKLTASDAYRLRVGTHRIIYEIDEQQRVVKILMIEDRKNAYRRLNR